MGGSEVDKMPVPGRWYEDLDEFDALDPAARPRRGAVDERWNVPQVRPEGVRKRFRSRPSRGEVAPWGGRFYWCAFCNYVNTEQEGQSVRCPTHRREWERAKKEAQREFARITAKRAEDTVALTVTYGDIRELQRLAAASGAASARLRTALREYEHQPAAHLVRQVPPILEADSALLALVRDWLSRVAEREVRRSPKRM
jgi:hypothetical protein